MPVEIAVALITMGGSALGTLGGILVSSKMTNYRLQLLEEEVKTHNNFARRMPVVEEKIENINHRIDKLEKEN